MTSCVTPADPIYVAIFRKCWPQPAYYATKHTLIFVQLTLTSTAADVISPTTLLLLVPLCCTWNIFSNHFMLRTKKEHQYTAIQVIFTPV